MTEFGALESYFSPPREKYIDEDFAKIANLLRFSGLSNYSQSPRLYTILRRLGCENDLDIFQKKGLSDSSLPLSQTQLPSDFREGWKIRYLKSQDIVCGGSNAVRMMGSKEHMTLTRAPDCFISEREFKPGGRGVVDKVFYTVGGQFYARKRILRQFMQEKDTSAAKAFANEVKSMKSISHHHCVELVASYTDPTFFAFLMLPVAEYNLADYLEEVVQDDEKRSFLPSFFGCLSRGLWHIHQQKLRHRDIKPENILVSNNKVLFTDFDCAHDWSHTLHSTTIGVPPRTQEYASPEVAYSGFQKNPQVNSSSDIWSLGCVFLEIINVWKKQSAVELDSLRRSGYYNNLNGIHDHLDKLRTITTKPSITGVLEWIQGMLQENPKLRPTAQRLVEMTSNFCCIECKAHDNRLIMDGETAVSSQTADLEGMRNPENEKTWDRDTYEMSAQPTEAKLRGPHESNVINAVCRDMGRNPLSLSEEHRALILATYNFVLKKVVGLNEI